MSLNVDTKNAKPGLDPLGAGLTLMVICVPEVTEKNTSHAQARIEFINALDMRKYGRPTLNLKGEDLIGVKANVNHEPFTKWSARIAKRFAEEIERNLEKEGD